jgi:[ribosomal protein S5]-alanine N-acetyltransferase
MDRPKSDPGKIELVPRGIEEVRADVAAMSPADKAEISAEWLVLLAATSEADPWVHGFTIRDRRTAEALGSCGFKGPPSEEGVVEIAYCIAPAHQNNGYGTQAAEALTTYAFESGMVRIVRAHTLPEANASTRVLTKCGFGKIGDFIDPEDGPVWRWEKTRAQAPD